MSITQPEPVSEGETATIAIMLSHPVARPVTVSWATADGHRRGRRDGGQSTTRRNRSPTDLTFAAGQTRRTVTVATLAGPRWSRASRRSPCTVERSPPADCLSGVALDDNAAQAVPPS